MTETRAEPAAVPSGASRPWIKWLLIGSLAFNVLVIGAMASRAVLHRHGAAVVAPVGGGPNLLAYFGTLPMERRRQVWTSTNDERQALRPLRTATREARLALREALMTEPFDTRRVGEAHARLLETEVNVRTASQRLITRIASLLTAEERRTFATHITAEGMGKSGRRGPPRWLRELESPDQKK